MNPPEPHPGRQWLRYAEAADEFGISHWMIRRLVSVGRLRCRKLGHRTRFVSRQSLKNLFGAA